MERSVLKDSREVVDKDVDGMKECRRGGDGPEIRPVACGQRYDKVRRDGENRKDRTDTHGVEEEEVR